MQMREGTGRRGREREREEKRSHKGQKEREKGRKKWGSPEVGFEIPGCRDRTHQP